MKKLILLACIAMTITAAQAQQGLHMAFKVAPQSSWLFNSEDSDDADFRYLSSWGLLIGPSFNYHFNDAVGLGVDFLFSKQGQRFYGDRLETTEFHLQYNYFKLPILLHFNSSSEQTVMVTGQFGPQFAFLTQATAEQTEPISTDPININDVADANPVNSVNIGVVFGFGMGFMATDWLQIGAGLRFDAGFTTEDSEAAADFGYNTDVKGERSQTIAVTGAIEFSLKYIFRTD